MSGGFSIKILSNREKNSANEDIFELNGEIIELNAQTVKTLFFPSQERLMDPDAGLHAVPQRNCHLF
jgi:hypothetical protein